MNKFKFLKVSPNIKIRFLRNKHIKLPFIVFLHGFKSDLNGEKPSTFLKFCNSKKIGFLGLEYSGHGKSSGKFINGNISKWTRDTTLVIQKVVKKNDIIFIGSSMGAWISLNQFSLIKNKIKGFLGIGSAPEFLDKLMWNKFSNKMKIEIKKKGVINLKHGDYEYPITYQLIKDGRKNKILNKKIRQNINVTMVHGSKDKSVPVIYSKKVLKIFQSKKKKLVVIKNGDHSLSSPKWLKILKKELKLIIN